MASNTELQSYQNSLIGSALDLAEALTASGQEL